MTNQKLTKKERYDLKKQEREEVFKKLTQKRNTRRFLLWGTTVSVIALSVWGIASWVGKTVPDYDVKPVGEITESDWVRGNMDASVTLTEYGDFQCPACATYHPFVKQLEQDFPEDLRVIFRHFPLKSIHKKAQIAGQAVEAAGMQGKFWEMHDILFERQDEWVSGNHDELFISYVRELGLDVEKFSIDLESGFVKDRVDSDFANGQRAGINSTPSFFVDGTYITNPRSYDAFREIINDKITSK